LGGGVRGCFARMIWLDLGDEASTDVWLERLKPVLRVAGRDVRE
jgi:hypothetical protein